MINNTIHGDLLKLAKEGEFDVIVHGCNCFNTMEEGIAFEVKEQFPAAYTTDCNTTIGDGNKLGSYTLIHIPEYRLYIVNAYTHFKPTPSSFSNNIDHIRNVFSNLNKEFANSHYRFGIPKIGDKLGVDTWKSIKKIINKCTPDIDITLVKHKEK